MSRQPYELRKAYHEADEGHVDATVSGCRWRGLLLFSFLDAPSSRTSHSRGQYELPSNGGGAVLGLEFEDLINYK